MNVYANCCSLSKIHHQYVVGLDSRLQYCMDDCIVVVLGAGCFAVTFQYQLLVSRLPTALIMTSHNVSSNSTISLMKTCYN